MIRTATGRSDDSRPELVEGTDTLGPRVSPLPVARPWHLRSPVLEHRSPEPRRLAGDAPTFLLPPARALLGPSQVGLMVALPLLLLLTWQAALLGACLAVLGREIHRRAARADFTFGEGFLPYRSDETNWPRGVQEEDEVRWHWSPSDGQAGATN